MDSNEETALKKHQYDLDIITTFHRVQNTLKKQGGSSNIDSTGLRVVTDWQIVALGIKPEKIIRHKGPVVLERSSGSGSFYWWLSLALAVEKPALIRLRLNHFLKKEVGSEEQFLNNIEFTVLELLLQHDLPEADAAATKVESWLNIKRLELGMPRRKRRIRKSSNDKGPLDPHSVPIISEELKGHIAGIESQQSDSKTDYSDLMLQALLGFMIEHKILLDMSQMQIGMFFQECAEKGYILPNQKKSLYRLLGKNFRYKNAKGEYCPITQVIYNKYIGVRS
jgi:hypothetical protein